MKKPNINNLCLNAPSIVKGIGRESLDVYLFISEQFKTGSITENYLFQFVYRSFYRLDNAGLTPQFKTEYFKLMEECRHSDCLDPADLSRKLYEIPNRKNLKTLQFSFVTKLANTICADYPIYDSEITKVFSFRPPVPDGNRSVDDRLAVLLKFYNDLKNYYHDLLSGDSCASIFSCYEEIYPAYDFSKIPRLKLLDFFFWSAGKINVKEGV
jgi:hypothetical protein